MATVVILLMLIIFFSDVSPLSKEELATATEQHPSGFQAGVLSESLLSFWKSGDDAVSYFTRRVFVAGVVRTPSGSTI